jgi:hypothetical protein
MGYLPTVNFIGISCWLFLFVSNTNFTLLLAELVIISILITAVLIMNISSQGKLDWVSFIGLRVGFSFYAGWLTSATILGICIMLKAFGFNDVEMDINESYWGIAILIVAMCVYAAAGYMYGNPVYAGVYIWTLFAIRAETVDEDIF